MLIERPQAKKSNWRYRPCAVRRSSGKLTFAGGEAAVHFHRASARGRSCRNPSLARINAINGYVHRRTDGWNSLRYRQDIVVRQRPPVLANLFGQIGK
jgi:hypothetical protein